jgi:phosphoribosyl 1,2-cyclic phosphodiesterase
MSLYVSSINSGSNGNCYYVGNATEAVLIDVGISCREIEKRMKKTGLDIHKVKAIFISHEHTDHVRGAEAISKKYNLPVYGSAATLERCVFFYNRASHVHFPTGSTVQVGELKITSFAKKHDAVDPCSFIVEGNGVKMGVITDIGVVCETVIHYFNQCHAAFLEANYDEKMLEEGSYPYHLKKRIRGGHGHVSNTEALALFKTHRSTSMGHLFLAHLSKENNNPKLVSDLFQLHAGNVKVVVASRHEPSEVYLIQANAVDDTSPKLISSRPRVFQMDLFDEVATT